MASAKPPRCIVIAGPNGAGKTTFAREFLPDAARVVHFVNVDLIAAGLSPLDPRLAAVAAGRLVLQELKRLAAAGADFALESTLSGLGYVRHLQSWKADGYRIEIVYLQLASTRLAIRRVAARVRQGGHDVPPEDVARRFIRSWKNFQHAYRPLADAWTVYDNSNRTPTREGRVVAKFNKVKKANDEFAIAVGRALHKSARAARRVARMHATPVYIWESGKVVAERP